MTGLPSGGQENGIRYPEPFQATRAIVYSRVSTDSQEKDGTSLDTQERGCLEYAQAAGWQVIQCIRDTASGYSLDRPGIQQLRRMLQEGQADVLVAYALDRLSRNQNQVGVLFDDVEQAGAKMEFVTEKFEDTAIGRLILSVKAFTAEVEREKISERTLRGKAERARQGRIPQGTGKGIYGYTYSSEKGRRDINGSQATIVRRIFDLFCSGHTCNRIAVDLNRDGFPAFSGGKWHPLTIGRMLKNETYTGRTIYRRTKVEIIRRGQGGKKRRVVAQPESEWIDIPGATPAIISPELFVQAQSVFDDPNRRLRGRPTKHYKLRGRLRCLACNTPMVGQSMGKGRYSYYRCRRSYSGHFEASCDAKYVPVGSIERTVLEQVAKILADPQRILDEAKLLNFQSIDQARLVEVGKELAKIEEQQVKLADLYVNGMLPHDVLETKSNELGQSRQRLEAENRKLLTSRPQVLDIDQMATTLPGAANKIRQWVLEASEDDMELILRALHIQVAASREKIQIVGSVPATVAEGENLVTIAQTSA